MKTLIFLAQTLFIVIMFKSFIHAQEHHGPLTPNGSLYLRTEPVNNFIMENQNNSNVYYYVHLQGIKKENTVNSKHVPLNLSLVLDRSGSMSGEKLENVKKAVIYVINQLSSEDILSIVFYDSNVEVLMEPQRLENKENIIKKVSAINSGSSTNLEGGIRKGYDLVKGAKKLVVGEMVNRVLLLSDGLANVGISESGALAEITSGFFENDGISISTFGVGLDYNEDLMAKIAIQGGGMYYFINSVDKLPDIFNMELKGISKVVAQNTKLEISFPEDILEYNKTYAYNGLLKGNILTISFNDIFSEEQKAILIQFKTRHKIDSIINIECKLSYSNSANDNVNDVIFSAKSVVTVSRNAGQYNSGYNKAASEGYALQVTGEIYEDAVQSANNRDFKKSREKIVEAKSILENHFKNIGDNVYLKSLYQDFSDYEKIIDDLKTMDREKTSYHIKGYKAKKFRSISCPNF